MDYPIKRSGFIYNKRTAKGFERMRRQGCIMPPIRIEDQVTKVLTNHYDRLITKLTQATKAVGLMARATTDSNVRHDASNYDGKMSYSALTTDGLFQEIMGQLQDALLKTIGADKEKLQKRIWELLKASQGDFINRLLEDADSIIQTRVLFALDKDEVFQQRLDYLMQDYLAVSLDRIEWEENELKNTFLRKLSQFALGEIPDLESLRSVMEDMRKTAVNQARFFSRDQFGKLNKSLTLASFEVAEVEEVEWVTVGDLRVRPTHKAVNHKIFRIDNLPVNPKTGVRLDQEHLCRCALIPVFK